MRRLRETRERRVSPETGFDQHGSVIFIVILILMLLTVMGLHGIKMGVLERRIAANAMLRQCYYYTAVAGIEHGRKRLEEKFLAHALGIENTPEKSGESVEGRQGLNMESNKSDFPDEGLLDGDATQILIPGVRFGIAGYRVQVWNDRFPDSPDIREGLVWLQSDAVDAGETRCSIRALLHLDMVEPVAGGYTGSNRSSDKHTITRFTRQL